MLVCFDLDGTLITPSIDSQGKSYHEWSVLAGRRQRLAELLAEGHTVGIVTNQAGVAFGRITEEDFRRKIRAVLTALRLPEETSIAVCFAHPKASQAQNSYRDSVQIARRIPSGIMIRELMELHPVAATQGVLFVGDRTEDEKAAQDAGVAFQRAWQFFAKTQEPLSLKPPGEACITVGLAHFDGSQLAITLNEGTALEYRIDLAACVNATRMLETILQIAQQPWCTPHMLFDVVRCIEAASMRVYGISAQSLFCSLSTTQNITWRPHR